MTVNRAAIDFNLSEISKNGGLLHPQFPVHAASPHAVPGVVIFRHFWVAAKVRIGAEFGKSAFGASASKGCPCPQ